MTDRFGTFRSLSPHFHEAYFNWHSSGQYEGTAEFCSVEDVYRRPPDRERDDWYSEELRILDSCYRRLSDSRILEIGCGDGNLTWKLARQCESLVSWDIDPGATSLTRLRLDDLGLSDRVSLDARAATNIRPDEVGRYDIVFFIQVLEHVPGWEQGVLFDRVFSLVAPGGAMFISTPNRWMIRDAHDTNKLFIHWFPRWIRIPVAKLMKWGIPAHDPAWPSPPVLHDYVSFHWMLRRARRACPGVRSSAMGFYPSANEWYASRARSASGRAKGLARRSVKWLGRWSPLNYYFGDKVIFAKPPHHA